MEYNLDPVEIGRKLRQFRGDVPRSVVARKIGVAYSSLEFWERGVRVPPDFAKIKLAKFYGRSVEEIFFT